MELEIAQFLCREDNYGFLVRDPATGKVACIDSPDPEAILQVAKQRDWPIDFILTTHWHYDHADGNDQIKAASGARVIGSSEIEKASRVDRIVKDGDEISVGDLIFKVIATPGHTSGHLAYYNAHHQIVFVGDALFAMGCGKVMEGTMEQMWQSLIRLCKLPRETKVYCAHEYTEQNCTFALSLGLNQAVKNRIQEVIELRHNRLPTVPTTIGAEIDTNPFVRIPLCAARNEGRDPVETFSEIRTLKDRFNNRI